MQNKLTIEWIERAESDYNLAERAFKNRKIKIEEEYLGMKKFKLE